MTIIELPQGYYSDLTGMLKTNVLMMFAQQDAGFLALNPSCAPFHRPSWREFDVPDTRTAPWGHEWYVVDADGRLKMHSAQYDSSG